MDVNDGYYMIHCILILQSPEILASIPDIFSLAAARLTSPAALPDGEGARAGFELAPCIVTDTS